MVSIPGVEKNVSEQCRDIIIPVWGEFVLSAGLDSEGQPHFFEVTTHNFPGGQAATDLTANEIFQEIKLKLPPTKKSDEPDEARKSPLVYLGKCLCPSEDAAHIWMLELPDEMMVTKPQLKINLGAGSDPSSKFCTEIVNAEFISRSDIPLTSSGPVHMLRVHTDLEGELNRFTLYP
ncbi:MAG: hypothetical protein KBC15_00945 [Candidatus Levybacteria bacterium]|nr:hypothetical protein [Candidatus Levybacteria bacterium]